MDTDPKPQTEAPPLAGLSVDDIETRLQALEQGVPTVVGEIRQLTTGNTERLESIEAAMKAKVELPALDGGSVEKRLDRLETVLFKLINRIEATGGRLFTTKEKEAYRI